MILLWPLSWTKLNWAQLAQHSAELHNTPPPDEGVDLQETEGWLGWAGIFSHRNGQSKCTTHEWTGERSQVASRSGSQRQWCLYHYPESQDCFIWFYLVRVRVCICTFVYVSVYIEKDVHMCSYLLFVCRLWGGCCASRCVCMCVFLLSPSVCVSRDRSLAYPSSPRWSRRGGHSKQTQNSHPHAYTLFGGMPIADLRWGRCGL